MTLIGLLILLIGVSMGNSECLLIPAVIVTIGAAIALIGIIREEEEV